MVLFEWDKRKAKSNLGKHKVSFELAAFIFQDHSILSVLDARFSYEEERWHSIGMIENIILFVSHTAGVIENGEEIIRIISAREATPREKQRYYAHQKATCAINEP
jgi:uncharacterized DUF497 family protein